MADEGYIKFTLEKEDGEPPRIEGELVELNRVRTSLYKKGHIGVLYNGVGYGNVSIRAGSGDVLFIISGSSTGAKEELSENEYCKIISVDIDRNRLLCRGRVNASSESMSHAAVYEANSEVMCVIHIHSEKLFRFMLDNNYPSTPLTAAYGTPEMAGAIKTVMQRTDSNAGIIVMAGHQDGILAYGPDVRSVYNIILNLEEEAARSR